VIIDGHAHVSATDYGNLATLRAQLDQAGIDRALCVPGGMVDVRRMSLVITGRLRPNPDIPNHLVYDALDRHPDRIYGFVCVNPKAGAAAVRMMDDGFRHGCRGVKLAPIIHQCRFDEPALAEVAAACGEGGFPVYTHVLPQPGSTAGDFAALARRFPGTNFILGHMGGDLASNDAIDFAAEIANLYLETSLGHYLVLRDALARLGPGKLMFGSEFPLGHPRAELENVLLLDPSAHDAILRGNVLRLLGVPT
jgi:predicted TIM-barrel fold metal-dependent hydrolase